jgi:cell division protein FtsQ
MKLNKKKITVISGVAGILLVIILYIIFSESPICKNIEINFEKNSSENLIDEEDIKNLISAQYKDLIGSPLDNVDLALLENIIEKHPSVKNAEVYKKVDGILAVDVENRIPIVRIIPEKGSHFYIDSEGEFMPVSRTSGSRVLIANGHINFRYENKKINIHTDSLVTNTIKDIWLIASKIAEDNFMKAQAEQLYVTESHEYELIPKVGKHIVMLGDIFNYEKKLMYLKHFYIHVLNKEGWRNYKYINLKYKGQIVCTKNE